MKLVWSAKFLRAVRKIARRKPDILDQIEAALKRLEADPYDPKLRSHALSGEFDGCWACTAGYDLRIIFEFIGSKKSAQKEIHLLNIGTHDEVY